MKKESPCLIGIFTLVTLCKLGFHERGIHGSSFKWMKFITSMCDLYKFDLRWKNRKFQKKVCAVYIAYCLLRCLSISNNTKPALFVQMSRVFQITPNLKHLGKKQTYQQQHYLLKVSKAIEGRVWFWHLRAFSFTKFIVCVFLIYDAVFMINSIEMPANTSFWCVILDGFDIQIPIRAFFQSK